MLCHEMLNFQNPETTFLNWHISEQNDWSSKLYLFAQQRNLQQKHMRYKTCFSSQPSHLMKPKNLPLLSSWSKVRGSET